MKRFGYIILLLLFLLTTPSFAEQKILNVYGWASEIPDQLIRQFEKETGIKVNFSTYENNEIMYAKLRATKHPGYDILIPTSYFVDRMRRQNMLAKLDKMKIPNLKNIDSQFLNPSYDPHSDYSVPFLWGTTGIFFNDNYFGQNEIRKWNDLWETRFQDKLLLLNDTREVFSIALLTLGYSPNDNNPIHIKQAFDKLKGLMKNVKVFSSDTVVSIIIDEDATVGMAWNGDAYKATQDNPNVKFIYPEEGFVIWVDNLAIPENAPHKENAYAFIDYLLRPEIGKEIALFTNFPTANLAAKQLLPATVRNNQYIYPPNAILQRGQFQLDLNEETLRLYEKYWDELKISI